MHGEIRCFNIAFGPNSRLIDFDFGARAAGDDTPETSPAPGLQKENGEGLPPRVVSTYPRGFKSNLADGFRIGVGGGCMTKVDDWYALTSVILRCHRFRWPADDLTGRDYRLEQALDDFPWGDEGSDVEKHVKRLKEFLDIVEEKEKNGLTVAPTRPLQFELMLRGFIDADDGTEQAKHREGSDPATGSPHKEEPPFAPI